MGESESHSLLFTLHAEGSILPRAEPSEAAMVLQLNEWSQHLAALSLSSRTVNSESHLTSSWLHLTLDVMTEGNNHICLS